MDRLISLEPSNLVPIRIESGKKCYGELTLRNVMYTMPVAFRIQALNKARYTVKPQSGIISPLATLTVEITYQFLPSSSILPETFPYCEDTFLLHSVVVPGASIKEPTSNFDAVPQDWFTAKKKQVFIDSGIKIMFVGSPILAQLVKEGSMDQIREVLERSDPSWNPADSMDSDGRTLLHLAISKSRPDIVQLLLEFEPDIELPSRSRSGSSSSTPLELASGAGEDLIVELLLARRASLERSETSKLGPIHLAAMKGHIEVLRLLLLKGANVNSMTKDGETALHLAVEERRRDCARLLLANGAKPDIRNINEGDTPLHRAAKEGDESMVKLLVQKFANKYIQNKNLKTAYDVAVEYGRTNLFDMLKLGDSLCTAARKGEVPNIINLIENGAYINGKDQHGWTALHRAAFKGKIEAVRALIDRGIEINGKDEDGYTALHCAVESGHCDVIELLVKRGADVEARTNKGITALQIAESLHYAGIIRVLLHNGAVKDGGSPASAAPASLPFGKNVVKQVEIKKRPPRSRALRSSFDPTLALAVL